MAGSCPVGSSDNFERDGCTDGGFGDIFANEEGLSADVDIEPVSRAYLLVDTWTKDEDEFRTEEPGVVSSKAQNSASKCADLPLDNDLKSTPSCSFKPTCLTEVGNAIESDDDEQSEWISTLPSQQDQAEEGMRAGRGAELQTEESTDGLSSGDQHHSERGDQESENEAPMEGLEEACPSAGEDAPEVSRDGGQSTTCGLRSGFENFVAAWGELRNDFAAWSQAVNIHELAASALPGQRQQAQTKRKAVEPKGQDKREALGREHLRVVSDSSGEEDGEQVWWKTRSARPRIDLPEGGVVEERSMEGRSGPNVVDSNRRKEDDIVSDQPLPVQAEQDDEAIQQQHSPMLDLKHPSELSPAELRLTVSAVCDLAADEEGVTCIISHINGLSLLQAVALAIVSLSSSETSQRQATSSQSEIARCEVALDALGRIAMVDEGRDWIAVHYDSCPSLIQALCTLCRDVAEPPDTTSGVSGVASAAMLCLSNLVCDKQLLAAILQAEADTTDGDDDSLFAAFLRHLRLSPSPAAITAATAIGNLAYRSAGRGALLASDVCADVLDELFEMADSAYHEAAAEAMTAVTNIMNDSAGLTRVCSSPGLSTLISGAASCISPWVVSKALATGDTEAVTDAAAVLGRLCGHPLGKGTLMGHDAMADVTSGLAAMILRGKGDDLTVTAMETMVAMLQEVQHRPDVVDSVPVGAILLFLRPMLAAECRIDEDDRKGGSLQSYAKQLAVRLMDGMARGLCVSEHSDGEVAIKAVCAYIDDAWMRGLIEDESRTRDTRTCEDSNEDVAAPSPVHLQLAIPANSRPKPHQGMLDIALKAADTVGRAAMRRTGLEAVTKWADVSRLVLGLAGMMAQLQAEQVEQAVVTLLASSEVWAVVVRQGVWDEMLWAVRRWLVGTGRGRQGVSAQGSEDAGEALLGLMGCAEAASKLERHACLASITVRLVGMVASSEDSATDAALPLNRVLELPAARRTMCGIISDLAVRMVPKPAHSSSSARQGNAVQDVSKPSSNEHTPRDDAADDDMDALPSRVRGGDAAVVAGRLLQEVPACRGIESAVQLLTPAMELLLRQPISGPPDAAFLLGEIFSHCPSALASMSSAPLDDVVQGLLRLFVCPGNAYRAAIRPLERLCTLSDGIQAIKRLASSEARQMLFRECCQLELPSTGFESFDHADENKFVLPISPPAAVIAASLSSFAAVDAATIQRGEFGVDGGSSQQSLAPGVVVVDESTPRSRWFRAVCRAIAATHKVLPPDVAFMAGRLIALTVMHPDCDGKELAAICTEETLIQLTASSQSETTADGAENGYREAEGIGHQMWRGLAGVVGSHLIALLTTNDLQALLSGAQTERKGTEMDEMD